MAIILVFTIAFATIYFLMKWYKILLTGIRIPGPWVIPMLGNLQMIEKLTPEKLLLQVQTLRETYGQSFRLWLGPQLWVFLHTPEEHRDALQDNTLRKPDTFLFLNKLIGNGLLISHGKYWETHRKALGPAFHSQILNSFTKTIVQHADIMVNILRDNKSQPLEISKYLFTCIMDIIIDTSMGKNLKLQKDQNNHYTHAFHRTTELLFERMSNPLLFCDFVYSKLPASKELNKNLQIIHGLMETVIRERQQYLKELKETNGEENAIGSSKKPQCLLDTLLTVEIDQKPLSLEEIRDEVNTFVLAGVDTTSAAMAFVLYALGNYPQEQQKLVQELQECDMQVCDPNTSSEFNKLEYLDMFLKECMRYYTTVPLTGRQTTVATKIGERTYPEGITLWINMYGLAHDKTLFEDPMVFKPSRFASDLHEQIPRFSYIPFSAGPHICIGRKYALLIMKTLTVKILQNFKVELHKPDEELQLMMEMVLKSKNGINLKFKERL